jgi:uncharacterized protein YjlB
MKPEKYYIGDNGLFPGNDLPVLYYKKAFSIPVFFGARKIRALLRKNDWTNSWKNGIYTYHHYHSNTHEVLVVLRGNTTLLLGGENGKQIALHKGDVIVIPAGVAHKNLGGEKDVACIGAYPVGCDFDMNYGNASERPKADINIENVPFPGKGPVSGASDPLLQLWKAREHASQLQG